MTEESAYDELSQKRNLAISSPKNGFSNEHLVNNKGEKENYGAKDPQPISTERKMKIRSILQAFR
jgi:hypothetical protein